jgi:hypothetical protein
MINTIDSSEFRIGVKDLEYNYQNNLTHKLDNFDSEFNQSTINEVVLWKVNRYSELSNKSLTLINSISKKSNAIDKELTFNVLKSLINESGIQLPMASTILRFRNPKIYQIIDQRVYRIIYGEPLKISPYKTESNINSQIDLYFKYLEHLCLVSKRLNIPFEKADRILYNVDKWLNKAEKLENF